MWKLNLTYPPISEDIARGLLSLSELERIDATPMHSRKKQLLWSRFLVRTIGAAITGAGHLDVTVIWNDNGPPRFEGNLAEGLSLSLAHSETWVLASLVRAARLGVDIERCKQSRRTDLLVKRFFHPSDIAVWDQLARAEQQRLFYSLWACKEALTKARGCLLSEALRYSHITMGTGANTQPSLHLERNISDENQWYAYLLPISEGYEAAAVCTEKIEHFSGFTW